MDKLNTKPLATLLFPSKEEIWVDAKKDYRQITIRMNHKGVVERGKKKSAEILSK